ncbi:unnamed protein product [Sphagnum balticum]
MHAIRISGRTTIDCSTAYSRNECRNSRITSVMPEMGNKPEQNANTLGIGMMTPGHVSQNSLQWKGFRNYPSITHTTSCKRNCFYKRHAMATTSIHTYHNYTHNSDEEEQRSVSATQKKPLWLRDDKHTLHIIVREILKQVTTMEPDVSRLWRRKNPAKLSTNVQHFDFDTGLNRAYFMLLSLTMR